MFKFCDLKGKQLFSFALRSSIKECYDLLIKFLCYYL